MKNMINEEEALLKNKSIKDRELNIIELEAITGNQNISNIFKIKTLIKVLIELNNTQIYDKLNISGFTEKVSNDSNIWSKKRIFDSIFTRLATLIGEIVLSLSEIEGLEEGHIINLSGLQNEIQMIFLCSIYKNSDIYINRLINSQNINFLEKMKSSKIFRLKFLLLYTINSEIELEKYINILKNDHELFPPFALSYLSNRLIITKRMRDNKDLLLKFLPSYIDSLGKESLKFLDLRLLCGLPYMNCSYSSMKDKEKLRGSIHSFIRKNSSSNPLLEIHNELKNNNSQKDSDVQKRVILILHEKITNNHAMYRCYAHVIKELGETFNIIGACMSSKYIDEVSIKLFNKHFVLDNESILQTSEQLANLIKQTNPDFIYLPSVGMDPFIVFISSFKLAKFQIYSLGHPGLIYSNTMDICVCLEGSKVTELDPNVKYSHISRNDVKTYRIFPEIAPKTNWNYLLKISNNNNRNTPVSICIALSTYKISYDFLKAIKKLSKKWGNKITLNFHIADSCCSSTYHSLYSHLLEILSSQFILYKTLPYISYLKCLENYDMFLSPFPSGNVNTLFDCIRSGLLGPCGTGNSFSIYKDALDYKYMGIDFLSAISTENYIEIANKLISDLIGKSDFYLDQIKNLKKPNELMDIIDSSNGTSNKFYKELFNSLIK